MSNLPGVNLMYVAEIIPPVATTVKAFESKFIDEGNNNEGFVTDEGKSEASEFGILKRHIQCACFEGLKKDVDYSIKVSTVVNGKTISEVSQDIIEEHEELPTENEDAVEDKKEPSK